VRRTGEGRSGGTFGNERVFRAAWTVDPARAESQVGWNRGNAKLPSLCPMRRIWDGAFLCTAGGAARDVRKSRQTVGKE